MRGLVTNKLSGLGYMGVPWSERRPVYGERDYKFKWKYKDAKMRVGREDEVPCQWSHRPGVDGPRHSLLQSQTSAHHAIMSSGALTHGREAFPVDISWSWQFLCSCLHYANVFEVSHIEIIGPRIRYGLKTNYLHTQHILSSMSLNEGVEFSWKTDDIAIKW